MPIIGAGSSRSSAQIHHLWRATNLLCRFDQARELGLGVVRRDATALLTEQVLAILKVHAGGSQSAAERVLQIMNPNFPEALRGRLAMPLLPCIRRALTSRLPRRVVDLRHRPRIAVL